MDTDIRKICVQNWRDINALHGQIEAELESALGDAAGLSVTEYRVLEFLERNDRTRMQQLGRGVTLSNSATTRLVDRLERRALLTRVLDGNDRRSIIVELAPQGLRLFHRARLVHDQALMRGLEATAHVPELSAVTQIVRAEHSVAKRQT